MKTIYLPADLLLHCTSGMEKTMITGLVARYCCIFNVDNVVIFNVEEQWRHKRFDMDMMLDIMRYMALPQYLRRKVIPRRLTLEHAGILPPLNIPSHPIERDITNIQPGRQDQMYRVGLVESVHGKQAMVDVGLDKALLVNHESQVSKGDVITIQLRRHGNEIQGDVVDPSVIPCYWGYNVSRDDRDFNEILDEANHASVTLATSKAGDDVRDLIQPGSRARQGTMPGLSMFFGPRRGGLREFFQSANHMAASFDATINFFPESPTKTIRLEEAIPVCLALARFLPLKKRKGD